MIFQSLGTRVFKSRFTRKTVKWAMLLALVWFAVHSFNTNYVVINSNGVHGVISRTTWAQIQSNSQAATIYNTLPTQYLMQ